MTPEIVRTAQVTTAALRDTIPMTELPGFFDRSFARLAEVLEEQGLHPVGPAYGRYFHEPSDTVDLEVGLPVSGPVRADREVVASSLPACRVARTVHEGPYDELGERWRALWEWIVARGLTAAEGTWEAYLTEPGPGLDPATMRTELSWPLRD